MLIPRSRQETADPLGSLAYVMACSVRLPVFLGVRWNEDWPSRYHCRSRSDLSISSEQVNGRRRESIPLCLSVAQERSRQAAGSVQTGCLSDKQMLGGPGDWTGKSNDATPRRDRGFANRTETSCERRLVWGMGCRPHRRPGGPQCVGQATSAGASGATPLRRKQTCGQRREGADGGSATTPNGCWFRTTAGQGRRVKGGLSDASAIARRDMVIELT